MQIAILGRQPAISRAELESLFGAEKITPISDYAAVVDSEKPLPQPRLGGTMKSARILTRFESTELEEAFVRLQTFIPEHLTHLPEGKLQFGVSVYGFKAQRDWLLRQMLTLKKLIKKNGRSVRIIENRSEALETAQILYNKLTAPLGWELLLVKDGTDVILAQTTAVQDIDAYSARDFDRPKRDTYVGMLPPKLAQIMINLAVGQRAKGKEQSDSTLSPSALTLILDPFCGTGVVLQEALLMGYDVYGSDISEKMVAYSRENLEWLTGSVIPDYDRESSGSGIAKGDSKLDWIPDQVWDDKAQWTVEQGDATKADWSSALRPQPLVAVVSEAYLGTPLTSLPRSDELEGIMAEANKIAETFLRNISSQLKAGTRLCLALPAWHIGDDNFQHLKMLDHLENMGYNRLDLVHAEIKDLIYHRENQIVARELTILEKI